MIEVLSKEMNKSLREIQEHKQLEEINSLNKAKKTKIVEENECK